MTERVQYPRHCQSAAPGSVPDAPDGVAGSRSDLVSGVVDMQDGVERDRHDHPATSAASRAPSSQHASRSALSGGPVTLTGGRIARHFSPEVIDSTARMAPPVSLAPCTYSPYGRRTVASRHGK